MNRGILLSLLSVIFLTGCATGIERIESVESRLDLLEKKFSTKTEEIKPKASETIISTEEKIISQKGIQAPESPTKKDFQAALKNAGFYDGEVDGKFGPKSKKAVEDFQAANELKIDGKVGSNTWDKLKEYYVSPDAQTKQ